MTPQDLEKLTRSLTELGDRIGRLEEAFGMLAGPLPTVEERLLQLEAAPH